MNSKAIIPLLALSTAFLSGCVSARSPVSTAPTPSRTTFREATTLTTAALVGAGAGYAYNKSPAATAVGAVAGLVGGALINNARGEADAQHDAELVEAARREERIKLQQEYWEAERMNQQQQSGKPATNQSTGTAEREVNYGGGYFEGVNTAPRQGGSNAALVEPKRP